MITNLPNFDIESISSPEDGLLHISNNLILLKDIALNTDFSIPAERTSFFANIAFIKRYYERVDMLLAMRGE